MSIILVDTFHHLSSLHPYTEPLEHYSVQVSQPLSSLFVIGRIGYIARDCRTKQKMKKQSVQEEKDIDSKEEDKQKGFGEDPE